ncbi:MAG: hypothetical protein ACI81V_000560 [Lentimonas sp.]|jgi:hypothetical protein
MKPLLYWSICWLSTLAQLQASPESADSNAIRDYWFNGAEINHYELSQNRYGQQHPGHVEFIFVTEPFLTEQQVKQESGTGASTDVLKLNALRTFNTGIYSYRTMTSTFSPIDLQAYPHALKSTTSVQDWCGQAFQQINRSVDGWRVQLRSYFQNEADQDFVLGDAWLEDELWLRVRLNPEQLPSGEFEMIPAALYTRFAHQPIQSARALGRLIRKSERSTYTVTYPELGRQLMIEFDTAFPHVIREWSESDHNGTTRATLTHRRVNSEYWSENHPADRSKRKQLGLAPLAD